MKRFDRDSKPGGWKGRKKFSNDRFGGDRFGGAKRELFKATCSECNEFCEVPFRPINGKPVFCRNCFRKDGDAPRPERKSFGRDRFERPSFRDRAPKPASDDSAKQFKKLEAKLDAILEILNALVTGGEDEMDDPEALDLLDVEGGEQSGV